MMEIKCADCDCLPSECNQALKPEDCPNCSWDKCCCWDAIENQ